MSRSAGCGSTRNPLLANAHLAGADLSNANLNGASLSGANLNKADLTEANLSGATVTGTNFNKVTWSNTTCRAAPIATPTAVPVPVTSRRQGLERPVQSSRTGGPDDQAADDGCWPELPRRRPTLLVPGFRVILLA